MKSPLCLIVIFLAGCATVDKSYKPAVQNPSEKFSQDAAECKKLDPPPPPPSGIDIAIAALLSGINIGGGVPGHLDISNSIDAAVGGIAATNQHPIDHRELVRKCLVDRGYTVQN